MLSAFLYLTLISIGAVICCLGLLVCWIDNYNLLKRFSVVGNNLGTLIKSNLTLLDWTLVCRSVGTIVFNAQLRNVYLAILNCCLFRLFFCSSLGAPLCKYWTSKGLGESRTCLEKKETFIHNYHTLHPVYRSIHENIHVGQLKKGNIILNWEI